MAEAELRSIQNTREGRKFVGRRRLGELLVETGLLPGDKLADVLEAQKGTGKRLGQILMEMGFLSEEEIAFALAMQLKMPFIDLRDYEIQSEVVEYIPEEICRKFSCIAIEKRNKGRFY